MTPPHDVRYNRRTPLRHLAVPIPLTLPLRVRPLPEERCMLLELVNYETCIGSG
jgi:hypothetical protein